MNRATPSVREQPEPVQASCKPPATEHPAALPEVLVIGYGSELRGDDGVGPRIATAVSAWQRPGLRGLSCHQLAPELAEPIAAARMVIFVDAALATAAPTVQARRVNPSAAMIQSNESLTPALSPSDGEREFAPAPVERLRASDHIPGAAQVLPLPWEKGEGWGEGLSPLNRGSESVQIMTHSSNPESLLALAQTLFGRSPPAWQVTVPAVNFEFGARLSPTAERGKTEALEQIRRLVEADEPATMPLTRQPGGEEVNKMAPQR